MRSRHPLAGPKPVLTFLACAASLAAQRQFAEVHKAYMPLSPASALAVRTIDIDGDGDQDLLYGQSNIIAGGQDQLFRNDGQGRFTDITATHLPQGLWHTNGIATGDVDGDGDIDFVTGDTWQNRLYLNDGTGRFTDATFGRMPVFTGETREPMLLDLDGDGDKDIVCANYRQERLYLNDGTGRFTDVTATHMPPDNDSTWSMAAADIDGDGDIDLAFASYGLRRLYRNDGSAHFTDVTATQMPGNQLNSSSMVFGDIDGDGDKDLFVGMWTGQGALYRNDGTGHYTDITAGRMPATLPYHWRARMGDVDADGDQDIVYSTIYEEQLFLNDGTGTFQDRSTQLPQLSSATYDLALADLDGDTDLDVVTSESGEAKNLWFNDGAGRFANATPEQIDARWFSVLATALADLDGDGDKDLVVAAGDWGEGNEEDGIYLNDGRGKFTPGIGRVPVVIDDSRAVATGDVDGDGDQDLVFGNFNQQNTLYLNDGAANFTDATATRLPQATYPTTSLALGDVDGDGDLDLVVGNLGAQSRLWLNNGAGSFVDATAARLPALVRETRALALGDLDGDGDQDLVLGNGQTRAELESVWINNGAGVFADESATRVPTVYNFATASLALGDVDGDGDLDLAVGNDDLGLGRYNRLFRNDGTGRFSDEDLVYDYFRTLAVAFADLDGDGDLDAVCGDYDSYDKIYINDGGGRFVNLSWPRLGGTPAKTRALALGDVDGDGDVDIVRGSDWLYPTLLLNHHRQLRAPYLAKIGSTFTLQFSAQAGYATAPQAALGLLAAAPANIALPWGRLGLDPSSLITLPLLPLPAPAGTASLTLPIPASPGLVGQTLYMQALILHGGLADARFSNVVAETFVR